MKERGREAGGEKEDNNDGEEKREGERKRGREEYVRQSVLGPSLTLQL
mgnify:CR=1 FL=1